MEAILDLSTGFGPANDPNEPCAGPIFDMEECSFVIDGKRKCGYVFANDRKCIVWAPIVLITSFFLLFIYTRYRFVGQTKSNYPKMAKNKTYGATTSLGEPSTPQRSSSPLPRKSIPQGHASVTSSVINLTNTVIGAGALAFPSAFASMGMIPGALSCLFSGCMTAFGLYLLSRCATVVGTRPGEEGRKASFNEVARLTFSKGWAIKMFDVGGYSRSKRMVAKHSSL